MAKIALRAYNQEIEELIEHGQIDEAIAHCRHILKTLPKHVATYRLLGKSYLESQRYGDAASFEFEVGWFTEDPGDVPAPSEPPPDGVVMRTWHRP